jgi:molybdopterin-containing oxidoreductase family iron-sulfur binding subunit
MSMTRRSWIATVTGGAIGLGAAYSAFDKLIPAVITPEHIVPGIATWYATTCRQCPAGCGMLVRNREGRALKCEGLPAHPVSDGKLCVRGQASVQGAYHPERLKSPVVHSQSMGWATAIQTAGDALSKVKRGRVAVITDVQAGSMVSLITSWLDLFGADVDRYVRYEPVSLHEQVEAGARILDRPYIPHYDMGSSDFVLSLDADCLGWWLSPVGFGRQFGQMRDLDRKGGPARLEFIGPRMSNTGAMADRRHLVAPDMAGAIGLAVARIIAGRGEAIGSDAVLAATKAFTADAVSAASGLTPSELERLADSLAKAKAPLVLGHGDLEAKAAAMLNGLLETRCADYSRAHTLSRASTPDELAELVDDMDGGKIDAVVIAGTNPVYSASPELRFGQALSRVNTVINLANLPDETAAASTIQLPAAHPLECWGDYEAASGWHGMVQPTMMPVPDWPSDTPEAPSPGDVLIALAEAAGKDAQRAFGTEGYYGYLRTYWQEEVLELSGQEFEEAWRVSVQKGGHFKGRAARVPSLRADLDPIPFPEGPGGTALVASPSLLLYDGREAAKPWLQELPDPLTRTVWTSTLEVNAATASSKGIARSGDVARVTTQYGQVEGPAYVWEGIADGVVVLQMGQGHRAHGDVASGVGMNAFSLLPPAAHAVAATVEATGEHTELVIPQGSDSQHDRGIVKTVARSKIGHEEEGHHGGHGGHGGRSLTMPLPEGYWPENEHDMYPPVEPVGHRWAMTIDLSKCTGCGACAVACQAENNVANVGIDEVERGHEMHWLRIDRYFEPSEDTPVLFQPMLCQHCDQAPCEPVCPVFAAVHNEEGLNAQVYNRCVGTRYCANNCPYKVRRFNWFEWEFKEPLNRQLNPDVTVRCRGVMEKCTFCIQRIREVQYRARAEDRPVRDGEVRPACVQTCPTGALVFGDLLNPEARVTEIIRHDPRAYQVLHHFNTKPGVIYLKRVIQA